MMKKTTMFIPSSEPSVRLELIVARPQSKGPHPTLVFNHGSTGSAHPTMISKSECPTTVLNYFTERGWLVLFPQRRGRGKSEGQYAEGLTAERNDYSCELETAMLGFERAVEDLDAVMTHVKSRDDVDLSRLAIGGASRGGVLSIAYAGMRPTQFCGAINFNGGWLGKLCATYEKINPLLFGLGTTAGFPTLWFHGTKDQYYPIRHCRSNFDRYISNGGRGTFVSAVGGHGLVHKPQLWKHALDRYLELIEQRS